MNYNLFEELKHKREQVKKFAKVALEKSWVSQEDYQELISKIDNDILTIGVIGQMKAGKSTFLNAFLFGDEILPSATTPMTAALSVITYGEKKELEVEFYNSNEWDEMKIQASRSIESAGGDKPTESKIKAAKELVEKSEKIGTELNSLLGSTKRDDFENLIEYVGANGKYVSITKSVTVYYPEEWLKGVRVVDTPGFNDPVVSREERTQEFLKEADAVLLLLYAGRAFDATDRDIVFDKVRKVGIGKILIGVNKYDIQYGQGETVEIIIDNVKEEIEKACKEQGDERINELLKNLQPIPFSANMALMAKQPLNQILNNETVKFYWDKACDDFEISSQEQMLEKSLISDLEKAFRETIENSKGEILLKKPVNFILQSGINKLEDIKGKIDKNIANINNLSLDDEGWEDKIKEFEKAEKRILNILDNKIQDFTDAKIARDLRDNIESEINSFRDKMRREISNAGRFERDSTLRMLSDRSSYLIAEIRNIAEKADAKLKKEIDDSTNEIFTEIEMVLRRYINNDYEDIRDSFRRAIRELNIKEDWNIDKYLKIEKIEGDFIGSFFEGIFNSWREDAHNYLDKFTNNLKNLIPNLIEEFKEQQKFYVQGVNIEGAKHVLSDIIELRDEYKGKEEERSNKIEELEQEITTLRKVEQEMEQEVEEMKTKSKEIL